MHGQAPEAYIQLLSLSLDLWLCWIYACKLLYFEPMHETVTNVNLKSERFITHILMFFIIIFIHIVRWKYNILKQLWRWWKSSRNAIYQNGIRNSSSIDLLFCRRYSLWRGTFYNLAPVLCFMNSLKRAFMTRVGKDSCYF